MQLIQCNEVESITITESDLAAADVKRFAGVVAKVSAATSYENVDVVVQRRVEDDARIFTFRQRPPVITSLD